MKLLKKFQLGWDVPGQVLETTDKAEMHTFIDDVLDAGVSQIVIRIHVEQEDGGVASVTPIGG